MIVDRLVIIMLLLVAGGSDNFRALHNMNIGQSYSFKGSYV